MVRFRTNVGKGWVFVATTFILGLTLSVSGQAQVYPGDNAVFNSTSVTNSHAFIDASVLSTTGSDICSKINAALLDLANSSKYPAYNGGGVIDARGVPVGTAHACSVIPWGGTPPSSGWPSATILLPAGIIAVTKPWVLPAGTHLVGEGAGSSGVSLTTIQAESGFPASDWILQMGSTTTGFCPSGCYDISIQDLTLDGNGNAANGIINGQAVGYSYVQRVNLYQLSGIGIRVWNNASYSGPYSEIGFDTGSVSATSNTLCAWLQVPTQGMRGLRCISNSATTPAVELDAGNNSLDGIQVEGFGDGVLVGQNSAAQGNVLINVSKSGSGNVVHLANVGNTVSDISMIGTSFIGTGNSGFTIKDDVTGAEISDSNVAIYVLGESQTVGTSTGYSRFTTSKSQPAWGAGSNAPASGAGVCVDGAIFSCTGTSTSCGNHYLYVCRNGGWVGL